MVVLQRNKFKIWFPIVGLGGKPAPCELLPRTGAMV